MSDEFDQKMKLFGDKYKAEKYNVDTVCAIANIKQNKSIIKNHISNVDMIYKYHRAFDMNIEIYPEADTYIIEKELMKIGLFPKVFYQFLYWVMPYISLSITLCISAPNFGVALILFIAIGFFITLFLAHSDPF